MSKYTYSEAMQNELETMLDEKGMGALLDALQCVCMDKAEHLRANWQDNTAGQAWEDTAGSIESLMHEETIRACPLP